MVRDELSERQRGGGSCRSGKRLLGTPQTPEPRPRTFRVQQALCSVILSPNMSFFNFQIFSVFIFTEAQLIHQARLVSGVEQRDSVIYYIIYYVLYIYEEDICILFRFFSMVDDHKMIVDYYQILNVVPVPPSVS